MIVDVHHVLNKKLCSQFFRSYDSGTGLSIGLPSNEHFFLTKYRRHECSLLLRFINSELQDLISYTNIPQGSILTIRKKIKEKHNV